MMKIKKILLVIFSIFLLLSCKTKNAVDAAKPVDINTAHANKYFYDAILKKSTFENLKINSKIEVENGSFIPTLAAIIYIEEDQKIWMNLSAFINVARGIATPKGIKGYEKLKKTYIDSDFSYINKLLGINFIDFNSLQNLLVGKTFVPINERDFVLKKNAEGYTLESSKTQKVVTDGKSNEYKITLNYSLDFDLTKVTLQDANSPQNLEINYANWNSINNLKFPQNVKIIIKGEKTSQILIENTKFEFSKMDTPYSVPSNYTKTEIK